MTAPKYLKSLIVMLLVGLPNAVSASAQGIAPTTISWIVASSNLDDTGTIPDLVTINTSEQSSSTVNLSASPQLAGVTYYDASQQRLLEVTTSPEFAEKQTKEKWQRIHQQKAQAQSESKGELNWLENLVETLFGNWHSDTVVSIAQVIKIILIASLLAFIAWVIYRASQYGWGGVFGSLRYRYNRVEVQKNKLDFMPEVIPLPDHAQIPILVGKLLATQEISETLAAASILYRGGLRWSHAQGIAYIEPATTEEQCLNQLRQLEALVLEDNMEGHNTQTVAFLRSTIEVWRELAYNLFARQDESYRRHRSELQQYADDWLTFLPTHQN